MSEPTLYREATRDEIAICDLGVASAVDVYTMDVVPVEPLTTFTVEQHDEDFGTIIPDSDIIQGITMLHPSDTIRYAIVELGAGIGDNDES